MTTKRSQGAQANLNGKIFEDICKPIFEQHGFRVMTEKEWMKEKQPLHKVVVTQMKYKTIYEHQGRTEFVVIVDGDRWIRIENKWQEAAGSVDEKFPYMLLNAIEAYPEREIILVVDGGGYKPQARQWLVDKINNNWLDYKSKGKKISIYTIAEFLAWFNKNF